MIPKSFIRVEKAHTYAQIDQREAHNLRTKLTPNADPARADWNQEYVNLSEQPLRDLVATRIREAQGELKPRKGQVLCMEVLITASPEAFERDAQGRVGDMRESAWLKDALKFAQDRWGDKMVGCLLHQDEKTPHLQAFVVPINDKNRLSANTVFNPSTLAQLQTDFAEVMAPHGMERGLRGSRATHLSMQQMYARPQQTAAELAALVAPVEMPRVTLERPEKLEWLNPAKFMAAQEQKANAQVQAAWQALNEQLAQVGAVAVALRGEAEQARELRSRLEVENKAGTELRAIVGDKDTQLFIKKYELENQQDLTKQAELNLANGQQAMAKERDELALQAAQQTLPAGLMQRGRELHEQALVSARKAIKIIENEHFNDEPGLVRKLKSQSYELVKTPGQPERVTRNGSAASFRWAELVPGCHTAAEVVQREQAAQASAQQRGADVMPQVVRAGGFITQQEFEQKAGARGYDFIAPQAGQPWLMREREGNWLLQLPQVDGQPLGKAVGQVITATKEQLAREAQQQAQREVTQAAERGLKLYFTDEEGFSKCMAEHNMKVTFPTPTTMELQHPGGAKFTDQDILPNGRGLMPQYQQAKAGNLAAFEKEYNRLLDRSDDGRSM